jgi:hypothetical protein
VSEPSVLHYLRFVAELASAPDLVDQMISDHPRDDAGMCPARVCGRSGRGSPQLTWPCPTRRLAELARALQASRHREPEPRVSALSASATRRPGCSR